MAVLVPHARLRVWCPIVDVACPGAAEVNDWITNASATVAIVSNMNVGGDEWSLAIVHIGVAGHLAIVAELAGGRAPGSCVRVVSEVLEQII